MQVSNPGNRPVTDMAKTSDREAIPKVAELVNETGGLAWRVPWAANNKGR